MPTISVSCTGTAQDLADFCTPLGYTSTVPDPNNPEQTVANPESQTAFFQRKMKEYAANVVKSYRAIKAAEDARIANLATNSSFTF